MAIEKPAFEFPDALREEARLYHTLRRLLGHLKQQIQARWKRDLPLGDYLSDRWERAQTLGFGEATSIYDSSLVLGDVRVGKHTWIGPFTILDGSGGLEIGDYCSISAGVQLYSHDTVKWAQSGGAAPYERAATKVGSRVYIGPQTVVAKGVTIGNGCIIGAHSLVLTDVPANSRAFGIPCRVAGPVDPVKTEGPEP
ncbi:MAG: acyltransferase [Myxococcales bacterium]|nr:acyltransferase [Myxococcales bacterium]